MIPDTWAVWNRKGHPRSQVRSYLKLLRSCCNYSGKWSLTLTQGSILQGSGQRSYRGQIFEMHFVDICKGYGAQNLVTTNSMIRGTCWNTLQGSDQRLSRVKSYNFIFWISVRGMGLKLSDNISHDHGNILQGSGQRSCRGQFLKMYFLDICKGYRAQTRWRQTWWPGEHIWNILQGSGQRSSGVKS